VSAPTHCWCVGGDGTAAVVGATARGLTNGTTYRFRVAAVNAVGSGSWSAPKTAIPRREPAASTGLRTVAASRRVTLSWNAPAKQWGGDHRLRDPARSRRQALERRQRRRVDGPLDRRHRSHQRDPVPVPRGGQERRRAGPGECRRAIHPKSQLNDSMEECRRDRAVGVFRPSGQIGAPAGAVIVAESAGDGVVAGAAPTRPRPRSPAHPATAGHSDGIRVSGGRRSALSRHPRGLASASWPRRGVS
jgi:hypothetical protein